MVVDGGGEVIGWAVKTHHMVLKIGKPTYIIVGLLLNIIFISCMIWKFPHFKKPSGLSHDKVVGNDDG